MLNGLTLKNAKGEAYDLLDTTSVCMAMVSGLGFDEDIDYFSIGSNHKLLNRRTKQKSIHGTLFFNGQSPYKDYFNFVRFVRNSPLILTYTTFEAFSIEVDAIEVSKAELTENNHLRSTIKLSSRSLWYRLVSKYLEPIEEIEEHVYPYVYPETYPIEQIGAVSIESDSVNDSPTKITIYGEAISPVWRQYVNSKLVASGAYSGTIPAGHKIVIDATTMPYSILEYDGSGRVVADRYPLCDFSTERFFFLKNGKNMISVAHGGTTELAMKVEGKLEYASV